MPVFQALFGIINLFSENTYAKKANKNNLNGLFRQDAESGEYYFDSRLNHAQFQKGDNGEDDKFVLYNERITPNFIMYPFGNFIPFNDINNDSTQASTIDSQYLDRIRINAKYKSDNNQFDAKYNSDPLNRGYGNAYNALATQMERFSNLINKENPNWQAVGVTNKYYGLRSINAVDQNKTPFDMLYSLDYDIPSNFYFGMDMHMNFIQPKDGKTGTNNAYDMNYRFIGDDDVWVYIDNVLFLDLSGVHRHVGGKIDFVNGKVHYYQLNYEEDDVIMNDDGTDKYATKTFNEILEEAGWTQEQRSEALNEKGAFKDYTSHKFDFYYMERGSGSSVCSMNFNMPAIPKNTISVTKKVTEEGTSIGNPDFKFKILKANADGDGASNELFIAAGTKYNIYNADGTLKSEEGTVAADGTFTLKAGEKAEFTDIEANSGKYIVREIFDQGINEQYDNVEVSGTVIEPNKQDSFVGVDSPVKDTADGSVAFVFDNKLDNKKLGSLKIQKVLSPVTTENSNNEFKIGVNLDGTPIAVGTEYKVGEEVRLVTEAGYIILKHNETAVIENIKAGTTFEVEEDSKSANGYTVVYTGEHADTTQPSKATGTILPKGQGDANVSFVKVTNTNGIVVDIPFTKTITNAITNGGTQNEFKFALEEVVKDNSGEWIVKTNGFTQTVSVSMDANSDITPENPAFNVIYQTSADSAAGEHHYRIHELNTGGNFDYDKTNYIVKVTVTKDDAKGTLVATNPEIVSPANYGGAISFTNEQLYSLDISKKLVDDEGAEITNDNTPFEFTIKLTAVEGGTLKEKYPCVSTASADDNSCINKDNEGKQTISFSDGEATVTLKHGEHITINGLPRGTKWTVIEKDEQGDKYIPHYSVGTTVELTEQKVSNNAIASGTIGNDTTVNCVKFTNKVTYLLPETGGIGTKPFHIGGLLLMAVAAALLMRKRIRREG